ncbi:MAG: aminoacyl-tRNA deacylase [Anaerolineales bacterium]|nr:aminoacyl-tRNA deacylase [Anaerolineales bacterium]
MTDFKNNVTRFLDGQKVRYEVRTYDYDAGVHSAIEVAAAVGLPQAQVFKTLVALADDPKRKPMLIIMPGPETLDLKVLARAINVKKAKMATHDEAERLTGLLTGGISALALINKGFEILLDDRALLFETIAVSAGQRGAQVLLPVKDLVRLTRTNDSPGRLSTFTQPMPAGRRTRPQQVRNTTSLE